MDWIVAGLGNPSKKYEDTRHNVGWMALDAFADELGVKINRIRFRALCGESIVEGKKVLLMKPQTFMNLSGDAIAEACKYYNVSPDHVLIISDDIAIPFNRIRIRTKGSHGGHRGLKSIIERIGTDVFPRVRIGVSDRGDPTTDLADWVVGSFSGTEKKKLSERFKDTNEILQLIINDRIDDAMSRYNGDPK